MDAKLGCDGDQAVTDTARQNAPDSQEFPRCRLLYLTLSALSLAGGIDDSLSRSPVPKGSRPFRTGFRHNRVTWPLGILRSDLDDSSREDQFWIAGLHLT